VREDPPHAVPPGGDLEEAVGAARAALELGIRTIADPSAMFLGRDVTFMRRVAWRPLLNASGS
jgi:predicted metal-dependent phosphotriesterase family hydrolase